MLAAGTGQLDVINLLLDAGVNINHVRGLSLFLFFYAVIECKVVFRPFLKLINSKNRKIDCIFSNQLPLKQCFIQHSLVSIKDFSSLVRKTTRERRRSTSVVNIPVWPEQVVCFYPGERTSIIKTIQVSSNSIVHLVPGSFAKCSIFNILFFNIWFCTFYRKNSIRQSPAVQ